MLVLLSFCSHFLFSSTAFLSLLALFFSDPPTPPHILFSLPHTPSFPPFSHHVLPYTPLFHFQSLSIAFLFFSLLLHLFDFFSILILRLHSFLLPSTLSFFFFFYLPSSQSPAHTCSLVLHHCSSSFPRLGFASTTAHNSVYSCCLFCTFFLEFL